ncbi:Uncharacterised protein [uncultured archaeon]|nr:Uncharacterised protein [uncultured archaeon]
MEWKKIILAAIAFAILSQIVHTLGAFADMGYYTDPAYFPLWSPLMMGAQGPPGTDFYAFSIVFSLITGTIFACMYFFMKSLFKQKTCLQRGYKFGLFLFLVNGVTGTLSMYLIFAVPAMLLFSWLVQGLITSLAFGVAIAKIEMMK